MNTRQTTPVPVAGFDYGRGNTGLDRFVDRITGPYGGADYARKVGTEYAWNIAFDTRKAFIKGVDADDGNSTMLLGDAAPLPAWLIDAVKGEAWPDYDTPGPVCFQSQTSTIDWFALAETHPDELVLAVNFDPAPTVEQIRAAVAAAKQHGSPADLWVTFCPPEKPGEPFRAELDALFLSPAEGDVHTAEAAVQAALGGVPGDHISSPAQASGYAVEWPWMSGWVEQKKEGV
jgi:hypothetical protein